MAKKAVVINNKLVTVNDKIVDIQGEEHGVLHITSLNVSNSLGNSMWRTITISNVTHQPTLLAMHTSAYSAQTGSIANTFINIKDYDGTTDTFKFYNNNNDLISGSIIDSIVYDSNAKTLTIDLNTTSSNRKGWYFTGSAGSKSAQIYISY